MIWGKASRALSVAALCLFLGATIANQIHPNFPTDLTIPIVNIVSFIIALLSLVVSLVADAKNTDVKFEKLTIQGTFALEVILFVSFPLAEMGYLSRVN